MRFRRDGWTRKWRTLPQHITAETVVARVVIQRRTCDLGMRNSFDANRPPVCDVCVEGPDLTETLPKLLQRASQ